MEKNLPPIFLHGRWRGVSFGGDENTLPTTGGGWLFKYHSSTNIRVYANWFLFFLSYFLASYWGRKRRMRKAYINWKRRKNEGRNGKKKVHGVQLKFLNEMFSDLRCRLIRISSNNIADWNSCRTIKILLFQLLHPHPSLP